VTISPLLRQKPSPPPPRPRTSWSLRPGLIGLAVLFGMAVWATQWVFVQSARGQRWDEQWRIDVQAAAGRVWDARAHDFGSVSLRVGLVLCVVLALVALARRRADLLVRGVVLVAGANATTQILKRVVIERPDYGIGFGPNASPSGHTTLVASVAIAAVLVMPSAVRPVLVFVGAAWSVAVAASTVVSGWHRPSDTVAALLVCAGWAALVAAVRTDGSGMSLRRRRPRARSYATG
jgi:membrane-associated phospholipid phosphatase